MRKTVTIIKRLAILAVGLPIILLGLILIPLPGPGVLVCLFGLFILSLEFEWARTRLDRGKDQFNNLYTQLKSKAQSLFRKK